MHTALLALAAAVLRGAFAAAPHRPNIVLFLTDDLDLMLGGMDPIHQPKYIPALRARGAEVSHWCVRQPSPEPLQGISGCLPSQAIGKNGPWKRSVSGFGRGLA
jgi:hypothetical protein